VFAQGGDQTLSGDHADATHHLLHGRKEGEAPDGGPQLRQPEGRTYLGIGDDAGRVVVRSAGDEAGAEPFHEAS
jgi:hypothetical protein